MGSTDTISERSVKKTAKAAGKEAAREAIFEMQLGGDDTEGLEVASLDGNSDESLGEAAAGFDIFQDVGKQLSEKGEILKYIIKREGERVGSKYHPYSWERLAKDYGAGHYQVIARSESRNRFIKSQTQIIGDVEAFNDPADEAEEKQTQAPNVGWQQPNMGFLEIFNLMQGQTDRARQEANQTATQQASSQVAMITAMTEMMKHSQLQSQTMFMEITKMSAQMSEKMAATQEKIVERINQRMDKISEVATKKPEGPTYVELMKMQSESQNKGFELFDKIMKLAELKSKEKMELLEEARASNPVVGAPEKKSLTDSLIESLLPVIAASVAGRQAPLPQQPAALPQQRPLQRRLIRQPEGTANQANRPVQRGQGTQHSAPQAAVQSQAERSQRPSVPRVNVGGASVRPSIVMSNRGASPVKTASSVAATTTAVEVVPATRPEGITVTNESPVKEETRLADKVEVIDTRVPATELAEIKKEVKAHCAEILPVFLGGLMLDATEIPAATTKTLEFLYEHGISRELFLKNVEVKDLVDVAVQFNLPSEAHQWLNDLYAHIQTGTRTNARRKSATSTEQRST